MLELEFEQLHSARKNGGWARDEQKASSQASFWQPKKSFNAITGEPRSCQKYIPKQVHRAPNVECLNCVSFQSPWVEINGCNVCNINCLTGFKIFEKNRWNHQFNTRQVCPIDFHPRWKFQGKKKHAKNLRLQMWPFCRQESPALSDHCQGPAWQLAVSPAEKSPKTWILWFFNQSLGSSYSTHVLFFNVMFPIMYGGGWIRWEARGKRCLLWWSANHNIFGCWKQQS